MKKYFLFSFILIFVLFQSYTVNYKKKNSLQELNLKGKVKSYSETNYEIFNKFGVITEWTRFKGF